MTPSSTHSLVRSARGKRAEQRLQRSSSSSPPSCSKRARVASTGARARTPSQAISKAQPSPLGTRLAGRARIGAYSRTGPAAVSLAARTISQLRSSPSRCAGHERPLALRLAAVQDHGERAVGALAHELVGAAIPEVDVPGAVLAARDVALEVGVLHRVVLDVHRQRALARAQRHAARQRPAQQHAVALEPQVVVQPRGPNGAARRRSDRRTSCLGDGLQRLGRLARLALGAVLLEVRHGRP